MAAALLSACGFVGLDSSSASPTDASTNDTYPTDAAMSDAAMSDAATNDTSMSDVGGGDTTGDGVSLPDSGDSAMGRCGDPIAVASRMDVMAALPDELSAVPTDARRPSTPTLRSTGTLLLTALDFNAPDCSFPFCNVTLESDPALDIDEGTSVTVPAGTLFRIRLRSSGFDLTVRFEPPCATSCVPPLEHCTIDNACYDTNSECR